MSGTGHETTDRTLQEYRSAVDTKSAGITSEYRGKPLKLYLKFLTELAPYAKTGKDVKPYIKDMVSILIEAKRYLDLSTIYIFLKNQSDFKTETGALYPLMKEMLSSHINVLFTRSITYSSLELNEMFSDILGKDHAVLMELISFIFKEYSLFNAKLSENIYRKFIEIADEDLVSFIEHADSKFLAFYLSSVPHLPFVPAEHVSKWTELILYQNTKEHLTSKIIAAMKEHPSLDILLIFILSPKENERSEALALLRDCLEMGVVNEELFTSTAVYFLERSLTSQFYDFHSIPGSQKNIFAQMIVATGGKKLKHIIISMIREKNIHNDPKITETKIIFSNLLKDLVPKDPEITIIIRQMLKDETVEPVVKEVLLKITV